MPRALIRIRNIKMRKKDAKKTQVLTAENTSFSDASENNLTFQDSQTESKVNVKDEDRTDHLETSAPVNNDNSVSKFNRKFLDCFWKLKNLDEASRLGSSLEIITHLKSSSSSDAELHYAIGRLVQGLAANKQCARHGYYVTLLAVLEKFSVTKLSNELVLSTIRTKLKPLEAPTKREHVDQTLAQVLAYGAVLKSGRLSKPGEMKQTIECMLAASKRRAFMPAIAYGFLAELPNLVSSEVFQKTLWPIFKPIVAKPWSLHNLDTFNLLMASHNTFPTLMRDLLPDDNLDSLDVSNPECFKDLTKFVRNTPSGTEHPIYGRIARILSKAGTLCDFWLNHFDPSLFSLKPAKAKTALYFFASVIKAVDENLVEQLLAKNIMAIFINGLRDKEDSLHTAAENVKNALSSIVLREDVTPETQRGIILQLLKASGQIFDSVTESRFINDATPSFKKETVVGISEMYRQFLEESTRKFDRVAVLHHFTKLIHLPVMMRETEWKASSISFFARWAYFKPSVSPQVQSAMKETFHKSLDSPCRTLKDLSVLLGLVYDQLNELVPGSDLPEQVKSTWSNVFKSVKNIQKKNKKTRAGSDSWMEETFLILYLNMAFELLRDPVMPKEIIEELDACYAKAHEKLNSRRAKSNTNDEEPPWLLVITDILLSLLSRDQHLLRSVVVLVWSLLAEHLNKDAIQQVLDVLDPTKSETPLVNADDESEEESDEDEDNQGEGTKEDDQNGDKSSEDGSDTDEGDDDEEDMDDMDDDMDEKETVTDKLRMKIHEALGDSAALTDTESVDMDDLSDTQMESLDIALGAAFKEFRKARPLRKKNKKMPKDQTALMHFRLRCLDLIEALGDKEVNFEIIAASVLSLITLLEFTVKEPLQKPLMSRTRAVLRKLTNVRRFKGSPEETTEILNKLLQTLFQKPYTKRSLTPYISEDLVHCCSFVLRSAVHMIPTQNKKTKKPLEPRVQLENIFQLYKTNMSKFFRKRDSPVPMGIFSRALAYPWSDAGFFIEPLTEFAFSPNTINNRKLHAFHLLTAIFRNSTALAALGSPLLTKLVKELVQHSQRVLEEAGTDSKPKYFHKLFLLLRTVIHCPQLDGGGSGDSEPRAGLTAPPELCDMLKQSLIAFRSKGLTKQQDVKKAYGALCRSLGIEPVQPKANEPKSKVVEETKTTDAVAVPTTVPTTNASPANPDKGTERKPNAVKKKAVKRGKHAGQLEKKEAKKRRMAAATEGFAGVSFPTATVEMPVDVADADDNNDHNTSAVGDTPGTPVGLDQQPAGGDRPKKTPKRNKKSVGENIKAETVSPSPAKKPAPSPSLSKQKKHPDAAGTSPTKLPQPQAPATPKTPKTPKRQQLTKNNLSGTPTTGKSPKTVPRTPLPLSTPSSAKKPKTPRRTDKTTSH